MLSAGVGNDIVGWILLALCVALVNAGSGITALYVLLVAVGYVFFLVYAVRPALLWILRRTGSLHNGPTQSIVALTVLMVFASAFFTSIIGVHAIFGAFLIGLICPHEGGFAIKLTEKIEDLVAVFFLPLYFALSGLSTDLGLLDDGITWAYVIGVIAVAFIGKVTGGTLAARTCKLVWRESFTIGVLMSCKGLVELIVLNIGLQAKILSQRTFTIFVVMALVTTFATTPLVSLLFPPRYQKKLAAWKNGEIDWDGNRLSRDESSEDGSSYSTSEKHPELRKLLVCLRLDSLPSLFTFVSLLGGEPTSGVTPRIHPTKNGKAVGTDKGALVPPIVSKRPLQIHGVRMLELTERLSSVMKESEVEEWSARDPVVNAFYTFGQLNNVAVSGEVQLVPSGSYGDVLNERALVRRSDLILLPWSENGNISELGPLGFTEPLPNAFGNETYNHMISKFIDSAPCDTAVFVNNGFGALPREDVKPSLSRANTSHSIRSVVDHVTAPISDRSHHIFFPFSGGMDDHVALRFVLRLSKNPNVTATILLVNNTSASGIAPEAAPQTPRSPASFNKSSSAIAINPVHEPTNETDRAFFHSMRDSLPNELKDRVIFETMESSRPHEDIPARASAEVGLTAKSTSDLVVVGRGVKMAGGSEVRQTLGAGAEALIGASVKASVVVVHAGASR